MECRDEYYFRVRFVQTILYYIVFRKYRRQIRKNLYRLIEQNRNEYWWQSDVHLKYFRQGIRLSQVKHEYELEWLRCNYRNVRRFDEIIFVVRCKHIEKIIFVVKRFYVENSFLKIVLLNIHLWKQLLRNTLL